MDFISGFTTISGFLVACLLAIGLQLFFFSPISPDILEFPPISSSLAPSNSKLQDVEKLGEGLLVKPEDVAIEKTGVLYTATRDGWIKRLHKNGSWENWQWINSDQLLGITTAAAGGIIVCDCEKGLLRVTEDGVTILASHVNGVRIRCDYRSLLASSEFPFTAKIRLNKMK